MNRVSSYPSDSTQTHQRELQVHQDNNFRQEIRILRFFDLVQGSGNIEVSIVSTSDSSDKTSKPIRTKTNRRYQTVF